LKLQQQVFAFRADECDIVQINNYLLPGGPFNGIPSSSLQICNHRTAEFSGNFEQRPAVLGFNTKSEHGTLRLHLAHQTLIG